jgi:NADP-dependent 3-hydroxy acid dehydrogenase YdfG
MGRRSEDGFRGSVVVVTGASSGVGRAIARAFGAAGARVGLIARNEEALQNAAEEIRQAGGEALVLPLDLADDAAVFRAADEVVARFGRIDVWVNNAMVSVFSAVEEMTPAEYRRVTDVTYLGAVYGTLAALRHMRARDEGVILQIGSALAYRSIPLQSAYCAAKAAMRGFTDSLRTELLRDKSGIKLCMLQLPAVNTPQFDVVRTRLPNRAQPVPPIFQPELIAKAALYAARHPTRELWIAASTWKAIVGQKLVPGFADWYLSKKGVEGQQTDEPISPERRRRDNVDRPLPGDMGAHGAFDAEAREFSLELWLRMHRGWVAASVGLAALAGLGVRSWRTA